MASPSPRLGVHNPHQKVQSPSSQERVKPWMAWASNLARTFTGSILDKSRCFIWHAEMSGIRSRSNIILGVPGRDCNPGPSFSIPGFGIGTSGIPGSRDPGSANYFVNIGTLPALLTAIMYRNSLPTV